MNDTITLPRSMVDRIENVIRRLVAKVEPADTEAQAARNEAVALVQDVTNIAAEEVMQDVHAAAHAVRAERRGAKALLALAEQAEREGWSGPADVAQNHDTYAADALQDDLKRIHDYYR